ncbi:MAG: hypothetical protein ACRCUY_06530 [Thermoguttaceae bacterium]
MTSVYFYRIGIVLIHLASICTGLFATSSVYAQLGDCIWGGKNESTTYTSPYLPALDHTKMAQAPSASMNLGSPPPALPIQANPGNQAMTVSQTNVPFVTIPSGPVGSVGHPATNTNGGVGITTGSNTQGIQTSPGTEIVYVLPPASNETDRCIDGTSHKSATATKVVAPGTPGAIPVAVRTMTVMRPKVEQHLTYDFVDHSQEKRVNVVDPRTGKVVRSYCRNYESYSFLPWPHLREKVTYEAVSVKVAEPISLTPAASGTATTFITNK